MAATSSTNGKAGHTESVSLGCLPRQAKELTEQLRRKYGVTSAHFDPRTGNAIMDDAAGRKAMVDFRHAVDEGAW